MTKLTAAAALAVAAWQQAPVFRSAADVVFVNVAVTKGGDPVGGLAAADFVLLDNGVPQDVTVESMERLPIDVTLFLGGAPDSQLAGLEQSNLDATRLHAALRPTDRFRIVGAGDRISERPMDAVARPLRPGGVERTRGTALIDGLFYALAWPVAAERRHLVVAFTNALDTWSAIESDRLPELASRSDAVLHVIHFAPVPQDAADPFLMGSTDRLLRWQEIDRHIREAVRRTGGDMHQMRNVVESFERVLAGFRNSYLLRYTPQGVTRTGWHELSVKVKRPGSFTIKTRKGYEGG
jgi:hypothetical protein